MTYAHITAEMDGPLLILTLNRPDKLNAYTAQMGAELEHAFRSADEDDAVRVVIVTGAGRGFCAGADMSSGEEAFDTTGGGAVMFQGSKARATPGGFVQAIYDCRKPSIAAINGAAVGVGITLTLPMDVRIASTDAKIGFVFARRGLVPEAGSAWFLPRLVGLDQSLRWCLSGRVFGAEEAKAGGLVSEVRAPDRLMARAREIALEIAENTAPVSVALTRHMLWQYSTAAHPFDLLRVDGPVNIELGAGADVKEGVAAFFAKRKPSFPGKVSSDMPKSWRLPER
jgi:enoyl-CoA hydratase/carnithine racemase